MWHGTFLNHPNGLLYKFTIQDYFGSRIILRVGDTPASFACQPLAAVSLTRCVRDNSL